MRTSYRNYNTPPTNIYFFEREQTVNVSTYEPRIIDYFDKNIRMDGVLEIVCAADGAMIYCFTKDFFLDLLTHNLKAEEAPIPTAPLAADVPLDESASVGDIPLDVPCDADEEPDSDQISIYE